MAKRRAKPRPPTKQTASDLKGLSADTIRLLAGEEGQEVDFKRIPEGVRSDDLVALANARGGTILVGVDEVAGPGGLQTGTIVGSDVSEVTKRNLINAASNCRPPIQIHVRRENMSTTRPILRISVPEGPTKPYCTGGGTYKIRADGQNLVIDPQLLRAMVLQAEADEFVARFRAAADDLIAELRRVHGDLTLQIDKVEAAASEAIDAARDAEQAANEAGMWSQS